MANMSNYLEKKVLDHLFRGIPYPAPSSVYIALCNDTLDDTIILGSDLPEVAGGNYVRKAIASNPSKWTAPDDDGIIKNVEEIKWEKVTWEDTVKAIAIMDSATPQQGNVLFWGDLTKEKVVTEDDSISFAEEALSIQIDN
jgi:hypothetical protein